VDWIVRDLHVKSIVTGEDFRFGHDRRGDHTLLASLAPRYGYELKVVEKLCYKNRDISSSYIREEILKGDIETANRLLGYPFFMMGEVIHGRQLGSRIGIPTINMEPSAEKLLPPKGVYATRVQIGEAAYDGVTNVGCRPTVNNSNKVGVETHILDYQGELYGRTLRIDFYHFLRPEKKFPSVDALQAQMERDIADTVKYYDKYYIDIT
jgi:riboflavin kinase/FMN adenylyltransferase